MLKRVPELQRMWGVVRYSIPAEKCHRLTFAFSTKLSDDLEVTLIGFGYDGKHLGVFGKSYTVKVHDLKGVHLVYGFLGIIAIRVKDG